MGLVSETNDTCLNIVPGSHRLIHAYMKLEEKYPSEDDTAHVDRELRELFPTNLEVIQVNIPANHILFFRQDLLHSGVGYTNHNLRAHVYLDQKDISRTRGEVSTLTLAFPGLASFITQQPN